MERTPMEMLESGNHEDIMRVICDFSSYIGYPKAVNIAMYELVKLYQADDLAPYVFIIMALDTWYGHPIDSSKVIIRDNMLDLKAARDSTKKFGLMMLKYMVQEFIQYINLEKFIGLIKELPIETKQDVMQFVIDKKPDWNVYLIEAIANDPNNKPRIVKLKTKIEAEIEKQERLEKVKRDFVKLEAIIGSWLEQLGIVEYDIDWFESLSIRCTLAKVSPKDCPVISEVPKDAITKSEMLTQITEHYNENEYPGITTIEHETNTTKICTSVLSYIFDYYHGNLYVDDKVRREVHNICINTTPAYTLFVKRVPIQALIQYFINK